MFENVEQLIPIIYLKNRQNMKFINELLDEDVIPIGVVIKGVKSHYKDEEIHEDLLPCIIYKENYRA
jgi:hypothetical protein